MVTKNDEDAQLHTPSMMYFSNRCLSNCKASAIYSYVYLMLIKLTIIKGTYLNMYLPHKMKMKQMEKNTNETGKTLTPPKLGQTKIK